MPDVVDELYTNGVLVASDIRTITDAEVFEQQAPTRLRASIAGLRQWALDGQDAYTTWPTKTAAQKDAVQRETIRRFGVLSDRLADLLQHLNV